MTHEDSIISKAKEQVKESTRRLSATWTVEAGEKLATMGIDIEAEIAAALTAEIKAEMHANPDVYIIDENNILITKHVTRETFDKICKNEPHARRGERDILITLKQKDLAIFLLRYNWKKHDTDENILERD